MVDKYEPPEKSSGGGAFAGLVVGVITGGVLAGPIGSIVCGILGTVIGDQVEREKMQMERDK